MKALSKSQNNNKIKSKIDFKRNKMFIPGKVIAFQHTPYISSKTCLVQYSDGDKKLILCPYGLKVGNMVLSGIEIPFFIGNHIILKNLPLGTDIHNVELYPGYGGQLARSGGTFCNLIAKEGSYVTLRLPSGEVRFVSKYCWATIGKVSEKFSRQKPIKKAGQNRWIGIRPHVRGVVKNPVDHPHGGGEGRSPIGRSHPVTPWGRIALGERTRRLKKHSDILILVRRK
jgi:large subunit ribosomal protein L2